MPSRRPTRQLTQLLEQSPLPVYVVDEAREIVYCNAACAGWLRIDAAELVGQICNYHSGDCATPLGEAAAALCPPPQVFHGESALAHIVWKNAAGVVEQRLATFVPLGGSEREASSVLAVLSETQDMPEPSATTTELESQGLHQRLQQLTRQLRIRYRLDRLVGDSPQIRRVREQVRVAVAGRARVLIVGLPGSGREHVARTIHAGASTEPVGPLLPLSCESLEAEPLQSNILAFLRRCQDQSSKSTATVLLLDVDRLSESAQTELLAFFRTPTVALRTISTSRQPLLQMTKEGGFLFELAFALSTMVIELPALCDRREDIPLLAQRFVEEFNAAAGKQLAGFAPAALDRLASLPWTGNVEELAAVVREACRSVSTVWIGEADLPPRVRAVVAAGAHPARPTESIRLDEFLLEIERELIQRAMQRARGNKAKAARLLGVSRPRLLRRLTQLGLEAPAAEIEFKLVDEGTTDAGGHS